MSGKEKEPGKPGRKKKLLFGAGIIMLAAAAGTGATVWYLSERGEIQQREGAPEMELSFGEDVITAGGSTSVGMQEENFELDYIDTELVIEEVYLSSQDEVEAGTAILKLTDESVETARRELEEKATQADLDYREALLDGEEEKITAQQTLDTSLLNGTYATYTYEESLKEYEEEIESLQEQIEEAQELVDEYTASIESDYYYTYYEVAEKEKELNSTFAALMQLYEEWDVEYLEDQYQAASIGSSSEGSGSDASGTGGSAGASGGGMGAQGGGGGTSNDSTKLTVYDMLDEEVQENEAAYEEALENYEDAKATAEASLAQAQTNLELLKIQLEEAQIEYEKQQVSSQSDYDAAVSESGSAQETWQTEIERIDDEISVALNAKEEADENLQEFEEVIGDGYLYTTSAGTVMMVNVREETDLTGGSMVLAYSNPETVTVTASVDQEDIASIEIGEEAVVAISDYGNFDGTVTSINPVSASSSRSSVTYSVVVELTGDVSELSQNLSASVYFGVSTQDLQTQGGQTEGISGNDVPDGAESISGNEVPAGTEGVSGNEVPAGTEDGSGEETENESSPETAAAEGE